MTNPWFRFHVETINHPKVMRLPEAMRWHWVSMLCVASKDDGRFPPVADIAFILRTTPQRVAVILTQLVAARLVDKVDGGFVAHDWDDWQYKSDSSTARVQKHREKKKRGNGVSGNVSLGVTVTPPEQSRTETEQSRAETPRAVQADLVEEALRADLREIIGTHKAIDLGRVSDWIAKGYDPGMVREVVGELYRRKPDIASLAYFDAALAERHAKRAETPSERAAASAAVDWDMVISFYARGGIWSKYAGPEPGLVGCRAPRDLLERHGIDPATGLKIRKAG